MKRHICIFLVIITFLPIISCTGNIKKKLDGMWRIEEMKVNEIDYMNQLLLNSFMFDKKGECSLPPLGAYYGKEYTYGTWRMKGKNNINIQSKNPIFHGVFRVKFMEANQSLIMELSSDSIYVKASKIGYSL